jgi:hypothetical protein
MSSTTSIPSSWCAFLGVVQIAEPLFSKLPKVAAPEVPTTYAGGDMREFSMGSDVHVALGFEMKGGWKNLKNATTISVLSTLMVSDQNHSVLNVVSLVPNDVLNLKNASTSSVLFTRLVSDQNHSVLNIALLVHIDVLNLKNAGTSSVLSTCMARDRPVRTERWLSCSRTRYRNVFGPDEVRH